MRIDGSDIPKGAAGLPIEAKKPHSPEEAAKKFEEVLIKQMVHTMTKELFDSKLSGDDAPQWMGAYSDMQSDILTEELAKQISKSGRMGISELLIKQWKREGEIGTPEDGRPADPDADVNKIQGTGPIHPFAEG